MYGAEPCPKPSDPRVIGQLHPRSVGAIAVAVLLSEDRDGDRRNELADHARVHVEREPF
jgi:hypothetical protein